nr:DUF2505 domain-containing protein [Propionibacterium sp.]
MNLTARHEFPAGVDRVYRMCLEPEFLSQVCRDIGALEHSVDVVPAGEGAVTRISLEAETVPALAGLAGATLRVGQEMAWAEPAPDGSRAARLLIKVVGLPVVVDAEARLAPTASGSAIDYAGALRVDVPLLGGVLEKQAVPYVLQILDIQQASAHRWLATHP